MRAEWSETEVVVTIADDGPGFPIELWTTLGEPYVTTRPAGSHKRDGHASGLGLGFFIAKTLLERSGATVALENRPPPAKGALVRILSRGRCSSGNGRHGCGVCGAGLGHVRPTCRGQGLGGTYRRL